MLHSSVATVQKGKKQLFLQGRENSYGSVAADMLLQEPNCGEQASLSLSSPADTLKEQTELTS